MNKLIKSRIFFFILGAVIFGSISSVVAIQLSSRDIKYTKGNTEITVEQALNELYGKKGYTVLETGTYTTGWMGYGGGYYLNTITFENTYTADQKAIFVITKYVSGVPAPYIQIEQAFDDYIVGNQKQFYTLNFSGEASGTETFEYVVLGEA